MHCLSTVVVMSFNWLLCKLLMLHQVLACLHYPDGVMKVLSLLPQNVQSHLKEIQKLLDHQDLKIVKPSDAGLHTSVLALENIHETSHEPEALGQVKHFLVIPQ